MPGGAIVAGPQEQPDHPRAYLSSGATSTRQATAFGRATVAQWKSIGELRVEPAAWPAERDQALRRLDEILPLLEKILPIAAEIEAAYRDRAGGNRPPEAEAIEPPLAVATVTSAINADNVFRAVLSGPQPRLDLIRVCSDALNLATEKIIPGLKLLAGGTLTGIGIGVGKHIADEVWPALERAVHDLVVQTEGWLRTLGL